MHSLCLGLRCSDLDPRAALTGACDDDQSHIRALVIAAEEAIEFCRKKSRDPTASRRCRYRATRAAKIAAARVHAASNAAGLITDSSCSSPNTE